MSRVACLRPQPGGCRIAGITILIMAIVIPLNAVRAERPASPPRSQQRAEIVIFPGIRYARIPDSAPATQAVANGERDRLVLPD